MWSPGKWMPCYENCVEFINVLPGGRKVCRRPKCVGLLSQLCKKNGEEDKSQILKKVIIMVLLFLFVVYLHGYFQRDLNFVLEPQ
jgi:uncharacterized Rmd1/YagE family protein